MYLRIFTIVVGALFMLLSGCSSTPRIDASTSESFERSVEEVYESLPDDQAKEFERALPSLVDYRAWDADADDANQLWIALKDRIDGMTGRQVIELVESERNARRAAADKRDGLSIDSD